MSNFEHPSPTDSESPSEPVSPMSDASFDAQQQQQLPPSGGRQSTHGGPLKHKRNRVTPAQLVKLERYFQQDRSLSASRREEISEKLGMQERQTQIWFQNRRAKQKLAEQRAMFEKFDEEMAARAAAVAATAAQPGVVSRPRIEDLCPTLTPTGPGYDPNLLRLLRESAPIRLIPCATLNIGTWQRNSTPLPPSSEPGYHDLVGYLSNARKALVWFIFASGTAFKMEVSYHSIVSVEFRESSTRPQEHVAIVLDRPPVFYCQEPLPSDEARQNLPSSSSMPGWARCRDWTENAQGTMCLRHEIIGPKGYLLSALQSLPLDSITSASYSPSIGSSHSPTSSTTGRPSSASSNSSLASHYPSLLGNQAHQAPFYHVSASPRMAPPPPQYDPYAEHPDGSAFNRSSSSSLARPFPCSSDLDSPEQRRSRAVEMGGPSSSPSSRRNASASSTSYQSMPPQLPMYQQPYSYPPPHPEMLPPAAVASSPTFLAPFNPSSSVAPQVNYPGAKLPPLRDSFPPLQSSAGPLGEEGEQVSGVSVGAAMSNLEGYVMGDYPPTDNSNTPVAVEILPRSPPYVPRPSL